MLRGCRSGFSPTLLLCGFLATASQVHAQDSILGQHRIDLRLKPLPAADVLSILSVRSRSVGHVTEPTAEWGRPWTVEGADALQGIVVTVNFTATPVQQVVEETLRCVGYTYAEQDDRIVLEKAAQTAPSDQCRSVTRVSAAELPGGPQQRATDRRYSWHLQSISALDFIKMFSSESGLNIVWPYQQTELLRGIQLRVNVARMREDDVLKSVLGCIGWEYERTNGGVSAFRVDAPLASGKCQELTILDSG